MSTLVRPAHPPGQDVDALRRQVRDAEAALDRRTADVAELKAALDQFRIHYRQHVGLLHEQLDDLELRLAEAELGELSQRLAEAGADATAAPPPAAADALPRFTSDAVRKLFRDVAKSIHPDLARDDDARARRHALMVAANRAYALGDEEQLRVILQAWERSPDAVSGSDVHALAARLERRLAQIDEQLIALEGERAALCDTPLYKLKAMVDEAAAQGRNLVAEMVRRLQREILVTQNRLDAMTWTPER